MGKVTAFRPREPNKRNRPADRFVACIECGERHPIIRLADGTVRCLTAFADADRWFCRNRGCRATWLARTES